MEKFSIQYSPWFLILVLICGLAYAFFLYRKDKNFQDKTKWIRSILFVARALVVSLVAFFLLEPFFKMNQSEEKLPILVLAQDQSTSLKAIHQEEDLSQWKNELVSMAESLEDQYDVRTLHFGDKVELGLTDSIAANVSNISALFNFVSDQYYGLPLEGIVLMSDGIFNVGENPIYLNSVSQAPIYSIALGDTIPRMDLSIKNTYYNPVAFLGDQVSLRCDISAYGLKGKQANFQLYQVEGKNQFVRKSNKIQIGSNDFFNSVDFVLDANKTGTLHYRLVLDQFPNEVSQSNNVKDIFIDVIDSKTEVLLVSASPHPDLSAIRQSLSSRKNYDIQYSLLKELRDPGNPDVVILHNLPSKDPGSSSFIQELRDKKIPHLFIVGAQTDLANMNAVQDVVNIEASPGSMNDVQAKVNKNFSIFQNPPSVIKDLEQFPPLAVPFGHFEAGADSRVLLSQQIGNVETDFPLLAFNDRNGLKTAILMGEGLWKWRLNNYARQNSHESVNHLLSKSIQYLALKEDKRKWQVALDKRVWNENERVQFTATFYNDNFEAVNEEEARLSIKNESGNTFDLVFSREADYYKLDAGYLPTGDYQYRAYINVNNREESYTSNFVVKALQLEMADLEARHDILYQLGEISGGKMYYPGQIAELEKTLADKKAKPVIFNTASFHNLINIKWIFFLILALISLEWFMRRYHGAY